MHPHACCISIWKTNYILDCILLRPPYFMWYIVWDCDGFIKFKACHEILYWYKILGNTLGMWNFTCWLFLDFSQLLRKRKGQFFNSRLQHLLQVDCRHWNFKMPSQIVLQSSSDFARLCFYGVHHARANFVFLNLTEHFKCRRDRNLVF